MNRLPVAMFLASVLAFAALAVATPPSQTAGLFSDTKPNGSTLTTDTMQPATGLGATATGPTTIDLNWTASASTYAAGYDIYRGTAPGGPYGYVNSVVGRTTTTYPDSGLTTSQPYYYVVRATYQSWTSADSNEATATPN